jgi:RNA polymerase sigma-70 factor (family 1)
MATLNALSDIELLAFLKEGDQRAYAEIYSRYKGPLYIHAFNLLRDREEAKDVLQQVFLNLWVNRETIEVKSHLAGYLYATVRNSIFKIIAHQGVETKYLSSLADFATKGECLTDHRARENQLWAIIDEEVSNLPEKMRIVFELSRKANLSHKEIATQLGISEKTVKNQVNGALKVLRVKLGILVYILLISKLL